MPILGAGQAKPSDFNPNNVFNTFADRMWLYAAGLLLMDAILKLNEEAVPIIVSSLYGLILNIVRLVTLEFRQYTRSFSHHSSLGKSKFFLWALLVELLNACHD